jgi:hypothetical protein
VGNLGIRESNAAPPPLALRPEEIAALADELVDDHAAFAPLYSRKAQAQWGEKYLQGLLLPLERTSIEPMARAWDGGDVQAMPPCIGQGQGQDDLWRRQHWRLGEEPWGEADGVYLVDGSDVPTPGEPAVGGARQWCGHGGKVDHGQAGGAPRPPAAQAIRCWTGGCICRQDGSPRPIASGGARVASPRRLFVRRSRPWPWRWGRPA